MKTVYLVSASDATTERWVTNLTHGSRKEWRRVGPIFTDARLKRNSFRMMMRRWREREGYYFNKNTVQWKSRVWGWLCYYFWVLLSSAVSGRNWIRIEFLSMKLFSRYNNLNSNNPKNLESIHCQDMKDYVKDNKNAHFYFISYLLFWIKTFWFLQTFLQLF